MADLGPNTPPRTIVRYPIARRFFFTSVGLVLLGCGSAETSMPRGWRPLRRGAAIGVGPACPPIAGTYGVESDLLFATLVGQHLVAGAREISWSAFSLQGEADTALTLVVMNGREGAVTMRLARGEGYRCENGWLVPAFPALGLMSDGTHDSPDVLRGAERVVYVAAAKDGALVARLETTTHNEVPLWCGDGCKSMRVPFSAKSTVRWERQARIAVNVSDFDPDDSRLRLDPREARVTRRIRAALPSHVVLRGVSARDDGWHVSIDVADPAMLVKLLATLNHTPGIADARVERPYETLRLEGLWSELLWLRITSR